MQDPLKKKSRLIPIVISKINRNNNNDYNNNITASTIRK